MHIENDVLLAKRLAVETGSLLVKMRLTGGLQGAALGDAADFAANAFLFNELATHRPQDAVLSEEAADSGARLTAERLWILDPLDGTREYREGRDDFAVHVALVAEGKLFAAAVSLPVSATVFDSMANAANTAIASHQAVIVVSRTRPPKAAANLARALGARIEPMGSAGAKAMAVVRGDALAYIHEGGLNEWDAAAPVGVALAHGLYVSDLHGAPIVFNQPDVVLRGGLIICAQSAAATILQTLKN